MADDLSNYPNPLDNFRSYTYHFILTVSPTTEAMRKQVGPQARPLYSTVSSVKMGGKLELGNGEDAWLILDTRRFSQYSVTEFDVEHIYGTGDPKNPSIPKSTSWMKVIDTTGFTFFNFLQDVMRNKVKSSRLSSFFLLNILFIGHRDDDTTEVISSCYMPLQLLTMSAEVDYRGSICTMQFMETESGLERDSVAWQLGTLGSQVTVVTDPGKNSVADMVNALETKLNENSLNYYRNYIQKDKDDKNSVQQKEKDGTIPGGKLVQYMFNLPQEWSGAETKVTAAGVSKRIEQEFKATKVQDGLTADQQQAVAAEIKKVEEQISFAESGASQMSFSEKMTIADALTNILKSSEAILRMGSAEARERGTAVTFKIATNITSDQGTYIIHYDIYPYRHALPNLTVTSQDRMADDSNVIYYDYIFTGKNSHIEDMKITFSPESVLVLDSNPELGSSRLQQLSAAGQKLGDVDAASSRKVATGGSRQLLAADPVIATSGSTDQQTNFVAQNPMEQFSYSQAQEMAGLRQEFQQTLAFTHMLGSLNMDLTIRGNPNLLRKFSDRNLRGGVAPHGLPQNFKPNELTNLNQTAFATTVLSTFASAKQRYRNEYYSPRVQAFRNSADGGSVGSDPLIDNTKDVLSYPIFVKINIRTPDLDWSEQMENGQSYIDDPSRFYNGPYRVLFIKHTLIDGEFRQQLNMIPAQFEMSLNEFRAAANSRKKTV